MPKKNNKVTEGNDYLLMGGGVGAYGATLAVVTGTICPTCIIIAPALIGAGIYKKLRKNNNAR